MPLQEFVIGREQSLTDYIPAYLPKIATRQEIEDAKKTVQFYIIEEEAVIAEIRNLRKESYDEIPLDDIQALELRLGHIRQNIRDYTNFIRYARVLTESDLKAKEDEPQNVTTEEQTSVEEKFHENVDIETEISEDDESSEDYELENEGEEEESEMDTQIAPSPAIVNSVWPKQVFTPDPPINSSDELVNQSKAHSVPEKLFFVKDNLSIEAHPGDYAPFYAVINNEFYGYRRLVFLGWTLADEKGRVYKDYDEIQNLSTIFYNRERELQFQKQNKKQEISPAKAFCPWTEADNAKLIDLYSNTHDSIDEIANALERSYNSITMQIDKLIKANRLQLRSVQKKEEQVTLTTIDPCTISNTDLPEYLRKIEIMEKWIERMKAYAAGRVK